MTAADLDKLRAVGFGDREILDIALVVCKFNFMNRLADGLGVQMDARREELKAKCDKRVEERLAARVAGAAD